MLSIYDDNINCNPIIHSFFWWPGHLLSRSPCLSVRACVCPSVCHKILQMFFSEKYQVFFYKKRVYASTAWGPHRLSPFFGAHAQEDLDQEMAWPSLSLRVYFLLFFFFFLKWSPKNFFLPYKILWSSTIGNILILYLSIFFQYFGRPIENRRPMFLSPLVS